MHVSCTARSLLIFLCIILSGCTSVDVLMKKAPIYQHASKKTPRELALCVSNSDLATKSYISLMPVDGGVGFSIYEGVNASSAIVLLSHNGGSLMKVYASNVSSNVEKVLARLKNCDTE